MSKKTTDEKNIMDDPETEKEVNLLEDLPQEAYDNLIKNIENFNHSVLSHVAGTSAYEVVSTEDEHGKPLTEEHYQLIKKECARQKATVLFTFKLGKNQVISNTSTLKTLYMTDEDVAH